MKQLLVSLVFLALGAPALASTNWIVDASAVPPGNGTPATPYTSLQAAVNAATTVSGDTISVLPGDYAGNLLVQKYITIVSTGGPLATTIRGNATGSVVRMVVGCDCQSTSPRLDGFTITGVTGPTGTNVVAVTDGTVANCIITGNVGNGYWAYMCSWDGYLTNCTLAGNDNGARATEVGLPVIERVAFQNSNANWNGFGVGIPRDSVGVGLPSWPTTVSADPGFWSFATGDYHLRPGSPCINLAGSHVGALPFDPNYTPPSFAFCFGDDTFVDHTTACPCGNTGAAGHGCANSANANGALLAASGSAQDDDIVLFGSGMSATAFGVFLQHDAPGETIFHDGVLCAGGNLRRLRNRTAFGGVNVFPDGAYPADATTTLSQRGLVAPGSGAVRYYSLFYRASAATFCPPATANVTNGWTIVW